MAPFKGFPLVALTHRVCAGPFVYRCIESFDFSMVSLNIVYIYINIFIWGEMLGGGHYALCKGVLKALKTCFLNQLSVSDGVLYEHAIWIKHLNLNLMTVLESFKSDQTNHSPEED